MHPDLWSQVKKIVREALKLAPDHRETFLSEACKEDVALRAEIDSLLRHDAEVNRAGFLDEPARDSGSDTWSGGKSALESTAIPKKQASQADTEPIPEKIGRYEVRGQLGAGGFGFVYRGYDADLQREIAIKVARKGSVRDAEQVERQILEARTVAKLDHSNIVPVYDVGHTDDHRFYIVSKLIDGCDLKRRMQESQLFPEETAKLIAHVADALHHAHLHKISHRDIKPANILIDASGTPFVADFGLALTDEEFGDERVVQGGTVAYMSPEQARQEGHRIDGRSDIFSLGIVLYEMLTGTRPFHGKPAQVIDQIKTLDARPPRQLKDEIPKELERICLRALAKRATERYTTALDMAEDLRTWRGKAIAAESTASISATEPTVAPAIEQTQSVPIVPKGLRSFDEHDADFFLRLLPGPRDRHGLPDSIRFWKTRIEEQASDKTFSVGLIYGPSGCGKSSLVKAGLLPRLSKEVVTVYVEAAAGETEARLLKTMRNRCVHLPEVNLIESFRLLRQGRGLAGQAKVLIVMDQFEQWLHAWPDDKHAELLEAIRQCDGRHVQCIMLVRDDFWMAVTRFFRQLEIPLIEGRNSVAVDLFDLDHARSVLAAFGRAFGRLPNETSAASNQQNAFLDGAVRGLSENGKVICVRLSLFTEMFKGKPWTPSELKRAGGTEGVGVTFLEESFSAQTAPPEYRYHQKSACAVLNALLPEVATDIKGQVRSYAELRDVAGHTTRKDDFARLVQILDDELRLVTPTDVDRDPAQTKELTRREGNPDSSEPSARDSSYFQLTHDYLVPSLRQWLRQKESESRAGRARLCLADRAAMYQRKPEAQQLPSWWEYCSILALTRKRDRSNAEKSTMAAAGRYYGWRAAVIAVLIGVIAWGSNETYHRLRASALLQGLAIADVDKVPETIERLQQQLPWARKRLEDLAEIQPNTPDESTRQLHARLALVKTDVSQVMPLIESLLATLPGSPKYVEVITDSLRPYAHQVSPTLWGEFRAEDGSVDRRFCAGLALAAYEPVSETWTEADHKFLVEQLIASNPDHQPIYRRCLEGVAENCLEYLNDIFENSPSSEQEIAAANALADFTQKGQELARLLSIARPSSYGLLFKAVRPYPSAPWIEQMRKTAAWLPPDDMSTVGRVDFGRQRAGAGITLARLGERTSVLPTFEMRDDPEALTQFIHGCRDRELTAEDVLELLRMASSLPQVSSVTRYALLLALGEYYLEEISAHHRLSLISDLEDWYESDPSSAVHGATGWLLRKWGFEAVVETIDRKEIPYSEGREWFNLSITVASPRQEYVDSETVGSIEPDAETQQPMQASEGTHAVDRGESEFSPKTFYFTFVVFQPGEYRIGSPDDEPDRDQTDEALHQATISRPFALLDRELKFEELIAFDDKYEDYMRQGKSHPSAAAIGVSWYDAVEFCRWLTAHAGMPESANAYPNPDELDESQHPRDAAVPWAPRNWPLRLGRSGFRLPTEVEREVACRCGTRTMYGYGSDIRWLGKYAWHRHFHAGVRYQSPKQLRPSLRGLFDMHGNLWEWCHDWYGDYSSSNGVDRVGPNSGSKRVLRGGSWGAEPRLLRSASHVAIEPQPNKNLAFVGFRCCIQIPCTDLADDASSQWP